jgi:hypothetical protein
VSRALVSDSGSSVIDRIELNRSAVIRTKSIA